MNTTKPSSLLHFVTMVSLGSVGLVVPTPINAGPIQVTTAAASFSGSASVTDSEGGGSTSNANASMGTSSLSQFDPTLGVLTGATINLTSTRTQTVWVTSTAGGGTTANFNVTTDGSGNSTARVQASGVDDTFSSMLSASDSCTDKWKGTCTGVATTSAATATNLATAVPAGNLDAYVGTASVTVTRTAPTFTAEQSGNVFSGVESTLYTLYWSGDLTATYDYLLHAEPSFDDAYSELVWTLNFGSVLQGGTASLGFDLFNLTGDRVGLELDGFVGSGDTGRFSPGLSLFTNLAAGTSSNYLASLLTDSPGSFSASYLLTLSDADVGAATSRTNNFQMTLNLIGTVEAARDSVASLTSVPEPASLLLLSTGLLGLGWQLRRRR